MNVLVVGSSVIDLFLEIEDKSHIKTYQDSILLKLGDKIPIDMKKITLGGDGANVSVGLKRLSLDTTFFTFFGSDLFSKEVEETLRKEEVELIVEREGAKCSLSMIFNFDSDRIIFSHKEERPHDFYYNEKKLPDFVYLASIGERWEDAYSKVLDFTKKNNIPMGFTPGTPQLKENSDILIDSLKNSKTVFINREEAEKILSFQNISYKDDIKDVLSKMKTLGMEVLSITDGLGGAYALDNNGNFYFIKSFGEGATERTGAGDAYASGFLSSYLLGFDIPECMRTGCFNANSVVSKIGAQEGLLNIEQMEEISNKNPEFKAEKI